MGLIASEELIASALHNQDLGLRHTAIVALARMKHGRLALKRLLLLVKTDEPDIRVAAIQTLVALVEASTEEIVTEAITTQRYHPEEKVRKAVETASFPYSRMSPQWL